MELHPIISSKGMNSPLTQFVTPSRFGIYEPIYQLGTWGENFKSNGIPNTSIPMIVGVDTKLDTQSEDTSHGTSPPSNKYEQEANKPVDKAYVQQLESCRLKLVQLEQELERARQQGLYISGGVEGSHMGFSGPVNSGIAAFEMEYGHWVEEKNRQICELRSALQAHISDIELHILVEGGMSHYFELFRMKSTAAKADLCNICHVKDSS